MSIRTVIKPFVTSLITSRAFRDLRWKTMAFKRIIRREPHRIYYFHQIDDPYSHLSSQLLLKLKANYDIELHIHLVGKPIDEVVPQRLALEEYARKDAANISTFHNLEFKDIGQQPSAEILKMAQKAFVASTDLPNDTEKIGQSFWKNNIDALKKMNLASEEKVNHILEIGDQTRKKYGHYLGAMFYYEGEWYWSIDRLPYLEKRLSDHGLLRKHKKNISTFKQAPKDTKGGIKSNVKVEFFPSIRSPYSYLAMPEILRIKDDYPVELIMRPVMPMVMRGLPVPQNKLRYIISDAKREADRINVPFGKINDPLGKPVLRAYSLFPYAKNQNKEGEFLFAFCQLAWSEGCDMNLDSNLKKAITKADLNWAEAQKYLDTPSWKEEIENNRIQLIASGLWGVPSFRLINNNEEIFVTWGRDRIWLLKHHIKMALKKAAYLE